MLTKNLKKPQKRPKKAPKGGTPQNPQKRHFWALFRPFLTISTQKATPLRTQKGLKDIVFVRNWFLVKAAKLDKAPN